MDGADVGAAALADGEKMLSNTSDSGSHLEGFTFSRLAFADSVVEENF